MMSLAKVHWTRRVALVLALTVGILSGGQGRFAAAAPQIIETTITKDRLAGADFGALPPGVDTVKLILNGPYDPKTNPKGYTGSAIYPPEGSIWKKTVDAQGRHVYQVAVTSATDNSLLATVMYCPEGGSGGSCTPGPGCGVGFGGSNQCGGSSSIMAQPTATNTVAERLAKSEPGGGINLPRMIAGKTFPNIKNINHIPHRTISVTVQPDSSKKSEVLGYLTLKITGKGAALYHKSLKTPLTEDTQIPVSPKKLTEKFYIVTNDEFTEPITIQSFFAFADSNGKATTPEEAACSQGAKATQCCMGGLGLGTSGGGGGCKCCKGSQNSNSNSRNTGGTNTNTTVPSSGGNSGYSSSSLHSPQNSPTQNDPCSSNSTTASTSAVRSSVSGTKNRIYPEDLNFGNGAGRLVREWPFVTYIMGEPYGTLVIIFSNDEKYWFDFNDSTNIYSARYGTNTTLIYDSENKCFKFTMPDGTAYTFNDLGEDETNPQGLFYKSVAPGGRVSQVTQYVDVTGDGMLDRIGEITRYEIANNTSVATERLSYNFNNASLGVIDLLQDVTVQITTDGGFDWISIRKVSFTYYGPGNMHGDDTDVKTITVSEPNGQNGWNTIRTQYYRYWNSNDTDFDTKGFKHALKYAFEPDAYVKLVAQYADPNQATDSQVATFANNYYEYDSCRRVTRQDQFGGTRSSTFSYVNIADPDDIHYNANYADGANNWKMKTVETWTDNSQVAGNQTVKLTTYTNYLSQALIRDFSWGTTNASHWIEYYHYDSDNRLTVYAEPSAVAGYATAVNGDDVLPPLGTIQASFKLDSNNEEKVGLVHIYAYDNVGNLHYEFVKHGHNGDLIKLQEDTYSNHTANGATVYNLQYEKVYPGELESSQPNETSYSYTYYDGTNAIAECIATLPVVETIHNGSGTANVRKDYFDRNGRIVWVKNERGSFTYNAYDVVTGAITQTVRDVRSGQGLTPPDGWGDLPTTSLHVVTDYTHDTEGRITQTLGPAHNVDGVSIRTASWTVYDDVNHETRTAQGYQVVSTGAYTLVNPVSITKTDADGRVTEQIQAVRGSGVTSSGALSASDTFAQSSYVRWTVNTYSSTLLTSTRVYHLIPSSGEGVSGTNYAQTSYAYDSVGRLVKTVAPNGTIYRNGLDVRGHVIWTKVGTTEENLVLLTENQYDGGGCSCGANGNITQATRYANASTTRVTQHTYDWRDRRLTSSTSDGTSTYITQNTYDNLNRVTQVDQYHTAAQDANLVARQRIYYDELSRVYKTERYPIMGGIIGTALTANFWYDASSNRIMMSDPLSRQTTWEYDSLSRVAKEMKPDPDGEGSGLSPWTVYAYDAANNLLTSTDRLDHTTTFGYDPIGRKISSTDPLSGVTLFTFDPAGNMATLTDTVNNTTSWVYDHCGRVTQETNALNASRTFEYDVSGNLVKKTDRNSRVTEYTYDYLNRRTAELWKNGSTTTRTFVFTYNGLGELLTASDPSASYTYSFDGVGRVTSIAASITGLTPAVTLAQSYNTLGRRSQIAAMIGTTADFINSYSYDGLGRMSSIAQSGVTGGNAVAEKRVDFTYDNGNQFASITRYNNTAGTQTVAGSSYTFDNTGRLTALTHVKSGSTLAGYTWTFDAGNRMTGQVSANDGTATYTNDNTNQLTGAAYTYQPPLDTETYVYDANGNRTNNGYSVGANSRITSDGAYRYDYDAEGNRVAKYVDIDSSGTLNTGDTDVTTYMWDYRNRLVAVCQYVAYNGNTTKAVTSAYDYLNRLIWSNVDSDGAGEATSTNTFSIYDNNQIILHFSGSTSSNLSKRYIWGPKIDQILADETVASLNTVGSILWPIGDHLSTVRDLARYTSGTDTTTVANHRVYNAFGKVTSETNSAATCLFGFTARPFDTSTGLQNNLNRWYDSLVGRWMSEDPIEADVNCYRYVFNHPLNAIDPSGLLTIHIWPPKDTRYGHVSMTLDNGTYISWWPQTGGRDYGVLNWGYPVNSYSVDAISGRTYDQDVSGEDGDAPINTSIQTLNEDAIQRWWDSFSTNPVNKWSTATQNCTTTIMQGLFVGGADVDWADAWYSNNIIWRPGNFQKYVDAINKHNRGKKFTFTGRTTTVTGKCRNGSER